MFRYGYFTLLATVALLAGCRDSTPPQSAVPFSEPLIVKTLEKVRQEYVENPDERKMLEGALNGMLMALDPYSCFFNPESYKLYTRSKKGEFGGIGIEVALADGVLKVIAPMDGMPGQKAGIKAGDMITHVDGLVITGLAPEDILRRLHGKPGTSVSLKISRGLAAPFVVNLVRELVVVNPVKHRLEGTVGYIRISHFNDMATEKLKETISDIQKSLGKSLNGIVLDLRNNPGGTLDEAVAVADLFLDSGDIVQVKGRNVAYNQVFKAKGRDLLKGMPIAVLINQGSASGSEIVAAALRDNHRAVLIGEKTYGKGSIQGLYPLENYGALKITIARFYTPKGEAIQGKGIQPDILLPLSPEPVIEPPKDANRQDKQLQRAIDLLHGLSALKKRA